MASGFERFTGSLEQIIDKFQPLDSVKSSGVGIIKEGESESASEIRRLLSRLGIDSDIPLIEDILTDVEQGTNKPVQLFALLPFLAALGWHAADQVIRSPLMLLEYEIAKVIQHARFDPGTAMELRRRGLLDKAGFKDDLEDLGYSDSKINLLYDASYELLQTPELLSLWKRGKIDKDELSDRLMKIGYKETDLKSLMDLTEVIPSAQDLISMAVREAFNDAASERFGYDEDFPGEILEYTRQQGLSDAHVKRYWRAHWQLPGIHQAFEMFHRLRPDVTNNPFQREDLNTFLVAADIPARFRDWLVQISYNRLTRVDIRRLGATGLIGRDRVYQEYLNEGQTPENAQLLTDFTFIEQSETDRALTRSAIQNGYKIRRFSRDEAINELVSMGYSSDNANFWLDLVDYDKANDLLEEQKDRLEFLYVEGSIDELELSRELTQLDLPSSEIENLIELWGVRRKKKTSLPTKADLESWYRMDIISVSQYRDGMVKRGYLSDDIEIYLEELDIIIEEQAAKEAERAQKESDRLAERELSSKYRVDTSEIEVRIAEHKLAIASIKVALHGELDDDTVIDLSTRLIDINEEIEMLKLQKANVKLDYEIAND